MSLLGSAKKKKKKKGADPTEELGVEETAAPAPAPKKAPAAARGVVVEKPGANIYTVMLALSLVAIIIACVCLGAEMSAYEWKMR